MRNTKNKTECNVHRFIHKNGDIRYIEWRGEIKDEMFIICARDIDKLAKMDKELKESKENFRRFFETMDDMVIIANKKGGIVHANNLAIEKIGYNLTKLTKMNVVDLHPDDQKKEAYEIFIKMIEGEENISKVPIVSSTGTKMEVRIKALHGKWNEQESIYAIIKDVTKQIDSEKKFNRIFQKSPAMIYISSSPYGCIEDANEEFIEETGYDYSYIVGRKIEEIELFPNKARYFEICSQIKRNRKVENLDIDIKTKKNEIKSVILSGELFVSGGEEFCLVVMVDVTQKRKMEEINRNLSKFKSVIMNIATTFINMPLSNIELSINETLGMIGDFVIADRVYVFEYDFKKNITSNTYEWCKEGISKEIDNLQNIQVDLISEWTKKHKAGEVINILNIKEYESGDMTKKLLQNQGIKSVLTVPMMLYGECIGFVGFDSVRDYRVYSEDEISILKLFTQILANVKNREKQESRLIETINEKSVLMKEIHHRVKNNLQIMSSLLYLQSRHVKDQKTKDVLKKSENRIKAMAMLHEKIYQSENVDHINFKEYITSVNKELVKYYSAKKDIDLHIEIDDIKIGIDKAILCGLIINELVTNSVQHGFDEGSKGNVYIKLKENMGNVKIYVKDDGKGFEEKLKQREKNSLGLKLVENLTHQLKGTIKIAFDNGSEFIIEFKL